MHEFFIHISGNEIANKAAVSKAFNEVKKADGRYLVKISKASKRSSDQNRYFHGPMLDIVFQGLREMGFNDVKSKEDAKMIVKSLFLKRSFVNEDTGEMIEYIKDTHALTKLEMNELIEDVIKWGAEYLNVQIPYPNEQLLLNY